MTRGETAKIIRVIMASYPNYHPNNLDETIEIWAMMLEDYTYNQIATALKAFILTDTSGFAPSIAQLIDKLSAGDAMSDMEAWGKVARAISDSTYHAKERFDELPEMIQKAVGNPSNLEAWAQTDLQSVENVIQSNFLKSYRQVVKREKELAKLPAQLKNLLAGVGEAKAIEQK